MSTIKNVGISVTLESWLNNLSKTGRSRKQALSVFVDALAVCAALWGAYCLRFGVVFSDFSSTWHLFFALPILTVLMMASLGIYRWIVRSSNRSLFYQLFKACLVSSVTLALLVYLLPPERSNPRSLFLIYGLLLGFGTFSTRLLWKELFDGGKSGEPVAVYGAGAAGVSLVESLSRGNDYRPVLLLDDNPALIGTTVCGLRVQQPGTKNLKEVLASRDISRVILAMPSLNAADYESKVSHIGSVGYTVQTIPTYAELVSGAVKLDNIRDISINDILGRSEVPPDPALLGKTVTGKVVMVTGAGGSIGSELCRQIARQHPEKLVALDHSEENLYKISEEIKNYFSSEFSTEAFLPVLCSVNDTVAVSELLSSNAVSVVFHAAAYKHVPIVEAQPEQGVRVNVFGTLSVLDASIENRVENFVLISTDKAVRPTNAMGATKRIAELILQAKSRKQTATRISMVRFGNVLGSSGSVVPKLKKQIEGGGPITLTDPNVTRYFMTIPEAAQLVLQASAIAMGGDVFVLDMGDPVRIEDLAISMVRMSGKQLKRDTGNDSDIDIVVQGLRPGEKMYEELFINESQSETAIAKVFTADEAWMDWSDLSKKLDSISFLDSPSDRSALRSRLLDLAFYGQVLDSSVAPSLKIVESNSSTDVIVSRERTGSYGSVLP